MPSLKQYLGHSDVWFGNVSILAVGDFYQFPPLKSKSLMISDYSQGFDLWHDLFKIAVLDQIMRQKVDKPFAELLNRLKVKSKDYMISPENDQLLKNY